jgi:hypothetical protein
MNDIDNKKPGWLNAKPGLMRVSDLAEFIERPQAEANQRWVEV